MTPKRIVWFSLMTLLCVGPHLHAQQFDARRQATQVCASCHGPRGQSVSPAFPRLAGQRKEYLETQLKAFRDRTRADPMAQAYMWGMASQLTDDAIAGLAGYYSAQPPGRVTVGDRRIAQAGRKIFRGRTSGGQCPRHARDVPRKGRLRATPRFRAWRTFSAEYLVK